MTGTVRDRCPTSTLKVSAVTSSTRPLRVIGAVPPKLQAACALVRLPTASVTGCGSVASCSACAAALAGWTCVRGLRQQLCKHRRQLTQVPCWRWLLVHNRRDDRRQRPTVERRLALGRRVKRRAERPHVRCRTYGTPSRCSGAMYWGVPSTVPVAVSLVGASAIEAMPKSVTTTRSLASRMLSGFRSRWTIPAACAFAACPPP